MEASTYKDLFIIFNHILIIYHHESMFDLESVQKMCLV